ncbi:PREDICTED: MARVEL domain-containing protein 3-like [Poecilia mexicana]|uniref:MARVEL domain-containing protein n=1 Tax=Poecilia mexicana TaxID=48701 RepID=A0A3B3WG37_9TELE|nr:PREDICTED: MARVEL domain-containing protein 3-like [Poecilia mexicana]XP_014844771.1 PREDICTED: MARVEL domain-containing protein 3-like [Poecilia mexicana]
MKQPPHSNRGHRERNGEQRRPRENRQSTPDSSYTAPHYSPPESEPPSRYSRDAPRVEHRDSKCTNICSRRGIVLICSVLTNTLVLICVVAAQMVTSGLSSMGGMGGISIDSSFNLQGTELQEVRRLDMEYSQMRAPGIYGGIAFSLTFGVVSLVFVVAGNKPAYHMNQKLLVGALAFQAVGAVGYVVAVGLYLHFVIQVNSTETCKRREIIYSRNGYTWMNCNVSGGDAAVALFGLITAILYTAGTVLTVQTIRGVKRYQREKKRRHAEKQEAQGNHRRAPLRADTTSV